jgi:hypothetical protein
MVMSVSIAKFENLRASADVRYGNLTFVHQTPQCPVNGGMIYCREFHVHSFVNLCLGQVGVLSLQYGKDFIGNR